VCYKSLVFVPLYRTILDLLLLGFFFCSSPGALAISSKTSFSSSFVKPSSIGNCVTPSTAISELISALTGTSWETSSTFTLLVFSISLPSSSFIMFSSLVFLPRVTLLLSADLQRPFRPSSQSPHLRPTERQIVWPKPTSSQLISCHSSRGNHACCQTS
jgi:hypothetical protein